MIEITFYILVISMLVFGLVVFIKMRRQVLTVNKDSKSNIIESKNLINPKITEALEKGLKKRHDNLVKYSNLIQVEKERLLKDDYIYEKIKNAVSKNEYYFIMCTDDNEITKDAINMIPGMKAVINTFNKVCVTFPNKK